MAVDTDPGEVATGRNCSECTRFALLQCVENGDYVRGECRHEVGGSFRVGFLAYHFLVRQGRRVMLDHFAVRQPRGNGAVGVVDGNNDVAVGDEGLDLVDGYRSEPGPAVAVYHDRKCAIRNRYRGIAVGSGVLHVVEEP